MNIAMSRGALNDGNYRSQCPSSKEAVLVTYTHDLGVFKSEEYGDRCMLRYTRDYLTPDICSLIKPAAAEKTMSFLAEIYSHVTIND